MSDCVLITGPSLAAPAIAVLEEAGLRPAYLPPYTAATDLAEALQRETPVGIIVRMGRLEAAAIAEARGLRVISKHGAGVDTIDVEAASARGIPVLAATGANALSVAEHTLALLLATTKRLLTLDASMRAGRWDKPGHTGLELAGQRLGLVGFGAIARHTARLAQAFAMEIVAHDPFCPSEAMASQGVTPMADLDELLATSQVVSLHAPLTEATRNLIDDRRLGLMRPDAILLNTARGGLIDEAALARALAEGRIAGAGLDSFSREPLAVDHPFLTEPRVLLTPHVGGVTTAANTRVGVMAAQGIVDVLTGRSVAPERIVNRAALERLRATA